MAKSYGTPGRGILAGIADAWGMGTGDPVEASGDPINRTGQSIAAGLDRARAGVNQSYDKAVAARRQAGTEAIKQMMGGMASPGAATLTGSGAQGLLAGGGAQASARQTALQASQAAMGMRAQTAMDVGTLLQQQAVGQLDYAKEDITGAEARFKTIADDIQMRKTMFSTASELVSYYRLAAGLYPEGSPERQLYLNEIATYQGAGKVLT